MKLTTGEKLIECLRAQRRTFTRTADQRKIVHDPLRYEAYEKEALRLQRVMSAENKKGQEFPAEVELRLRNHRKALRYTQKHP